MHGLPDHTIKVVFCVVLCAAVSLYITDVHTSMATASLHHNHQPHALLPLRLSCCLMHALPALLVAAHWSLLLMLLA